MSAESPKDTPAEAALERIPSTEIKTKSDPAFASTPHETTLPLTDRSALDIEHEAPGTDRSRQSAKPWWNRTVEREAPQLTASHLAIREALRAEFPSDRNGLDIARGDRFLRERGIAPTDATLELPISQRQAIFTRLEKAGFRELVSHMGLHFPAIDLVITFRDPQLEALNGPGITEMTRVHELVHSDGTPVMRTASEAGRPFEEIERNGYATMTSQGPLGKFIHEGWPQYVAGEYVVTELHKPHGLTDMPEPTIWASIGSGPTCELPSRYVYFKDKDALTTFSTSFAATAIGKLIEHDGNLLPALTAGPSDPEAYNEVIGRINAIQSGLWEQLYYGFNDYRQFADGLAHVTNVLGR